MKIYMQDIRRAGLCAKGARDFFKSHNLDFNDFLKHGIDIQLIENTQDSIALKVVDLVKSENTHEQT